MTPTNLLSEITNSAPTPLLAIISTASYTEASGSKDQISRLFSFKTIPIVSPRFIGRLPCQLSYFRLPRLEPTAGTFCCQDLVRHADLFFFRWLQQQHPEMLPEGKHGDPY